MLNVRPGGSTRLIVRIFKSSTIYNSIRHQSQITNDIGKPIVTKISIPISSIRYTNPVTSESVDVQNLPVNRKSVKKDLGDIDKKATKIQELPPSLQYVRELIDHYKENVVLTQMGSFYELYFEHATKYAPQLNISLTSRNYSRGVVPFAGFPVSQLSRYLKVLVNDYGYSVVIAQQFKKDGIADNDVNKFYRRVTRIVTPGTFIDEAFQNLQGNSYLLSIEFPENCMDKISNPDMLVGLSWCDVSTGELLVQQVTLKDLISAVTRIQPKEILLDEEIIKYKIESGDWYPELVELKKYFLKYQKLPSRHRTMDSFYPLFSSSECESTLKLLKIQLHSLAQKELASLRNLLIYVSEHLPDFSMNFEIPQRQSVTSIMQIDSRTSTALELHATVRDGSKRGSLLSSLRRTVTPTGTRILTQWLSGPSLDLEEIKNRQNVVKYFKENTEVTRKLILMLKSMSDISRILQRFSFGQGDAMELLGLVKSLKSAKEIQQYLLKEIDIPGKKTKKLIKNIADGLVFDETITDEVLTCLNENAIKKFYLQDNLDEIDESDKNGDYDESATSWMINPNYNENLRKWHDEYETLIQEKANLKNVYKSFFLDEYGARNIYLKQKQSSEYLIHLMGSSSSLLKLNSFIGEERHLKEHPIKILQKSAQSRWLYHKPWADLGCKIELVQIRINQEENEILRNIKKRFVNRSNNIRLISGKLGYLDVLLSFATLAKEKGLVCPKIDKSDKLEILGGRHIMVEEGLSSSSLEGFVKNDCTLSEGDLWVITGPNMGGKSTYLRQNAIMVILAQIGCFLPCTSAHIGLVDKIFSRVGSADDLYNELSTFMVEMIETSFILQGATNRSLAILDEIGRGTSGKEGTSIAFATLKYLIKHNRCRTLFATHFGRELKAIIDEQNDEILKRKIRFFKTGIVEMNETSFYYDHKLKEGVCMNSDAIRVAKSAGFPEEALKDANELLSKSM
ncbi:hypothetical protein Kpol_1048p17 [Vanderwaltozyma polyspora DSM 70294]|uniref:DNA mismatch repair proteins mutS family domain-containing protein n=1 Tax=Vanderwaltozyma polyspora (strain ATCC 22028 / DSM 70294 / BCRC 21397 / CBS 2163 / NBRC 10782 / NRRL Y-8283 / UCD 57-17) TaxID=436907 RepID=A7TGI0_VANPO|nr:uncharacterized protein Kpol_1048p17 [Vanderwaltozyma polyspora DSM 70294]EDO18587.1 hypothetical protein Kpol_1048p17 [Vanderwaltozyma polyspora DSM 70294]